MRKTKKNMLLAFALFIAHAASANAATISKTTEPADVGSFESSLGSPSPSEIISGATTIYDIYSQCVANEKANLPCFQSTGKTIDEIYTTVNDINNKLTAFIAEYQRDEKAIQKSFSVIVNKIDQAAVQAAWATIANDLSVSDLALQFYNTYVQCMATTANAVKNNTATTCSSLDQYGNPAPASEWPPATLAGMTQIQNQFTAAIGQIKLPADQFMQHVGGGSSNPYSIVGDIQQVVLNAILTALNDDEAARQGLNVGTPLTLFPASYINTIGTTMAKIISHEKSYFASRIAAAETLGDTSTSAALTQLLENGRQDDNPILSAQQQMTAFTFPGWSVKQQMPSTQSYLVGTISGILQLTNNGNAPWADTSGLLPTQAQAIDIATDIGNSGAMYSTLQQANPDSLPSAGADQQYPFLPPTAATLWTAEQTLTTSQLTGTNEYCNGWNKCDQDFSRFVNGAASHTINIAIEAGSGSFAPGVTGTIQANVPVLILDTSFSGIGGNSVTVSEGTWNFPNWTATFGFPAWDMYNWYWQQTNGGGPGGTMGTVGGGSSVFYSGDGFSKPAANLHIMSAAAGGPLQPANIRIAASTYVAKLH